MNSAGSDYALEYESAATAGQHGWTCTVVDCSLFLRVLCGCTFCGAGAEPATSFSSFNPRGNPGLIRWL